MIDNDMDQKIEQIEDEMRQIARILSEIGINPAPFDAPTE